jgi:hypothetical protein
MRQRVNAGIKIAGENRPRRVMHDATFGLSHLWKLKTGHYACEIEPSDVDVEERPAAPESIIEKNPCGFPVPLYSCDTE